MVIPAGAVVLAAVSSRKSVGVAVAPAALVVEVVVPMIVVAHERRRWCKKHRSGLNSASWFQLDRPQNSAGLGCLALCSLQCRSNGSKDSDSGGDNSIECRRSRSSS